LSAGSAIWAKRKQDQARMAIDISYVSAFGGGALSFLSPCVLPLVPPYLCYMAGISFESFAEGKDQTARRALIYSSLLFVLGFTTVFVALGASATGIGRFLRQYQDILSAAAGLVIIAMGLNFLGVLKIPFLSREARLQTSASPANPFSAYLMGLAFAFGWTPCIGPILGPILTLAGSKTSVGEGASLLLVYSLGLGVPFLIAALFSERFMRFMKRFRGNLGIVEKIIGVLLVISGLLFLTGGMRAISFWMLEAFPSLAKLA
jgi:cytochrome c-type biogenesis protein